jgi:thiopeptide-type bacteriocin biosynthesis protein
MNAAIASRLSTTRITWLSLHFVFEGGIYADHADSVILDVVEPLLRWAGRHPDIKRYFFIRYRDNDPHLRLRLEVDGGLQERVERELQAILQEEMNTDAQSAASVDLTHVRQIRWVNYEPEIERYGGEYGMDIAHSIAVASTDCTMWLLEQGRRQGCISREVGSCVLMLLILRALMPERHGAIRIMENYATCYTEAALGGNPRLTREEALEAHHNLMTEFDGSYARQQAALVPLSQQLWQAGSESLKEPQFQRFERSIASSCQSLRELHQKQLLPIGSCNRPWLESITSLASSYIHMTCNRLGVSLLEEAHLAKLVACSLRDSDS